MRSLRRLLGLLIRRREESLKGKGLKGNNKFLITKSNLNNKIDLSNNAVKDLMNSNRLIEPFSPTFEHPDDFLPSHQASFRNKLIVK